MQLYFEEIQTVQSTIGAILVSDLNKILTMNYNHFKSGY